LRFRGFEGEWVKAKLEDVTEKINSGKTPLGGESTYLSEGIVFIRSQNVNNDQLELSSPIFISEKVNNGMKNSVVKPNDILLNITGASLGRSCVVPEDFNVGNVNQHVCIIRPKKDYTPRFIQPILSSAKGQAIFKSLQTGSGREGLNFESIKKIELDFPTLDEQKKIADFLSLIDLRIQTQNKIIENLETLIKGLSEKLFDQKLKFTGFSRNWKAYTVSEFLEFFPTNSLSWDNLEYENGDFFNLHYGLIHQGLPTQIDLKDCSLPNIKNGALPTTYTLCKDGDIAFADASEDTNDIAKVVEFINCNERNIVCGLHTIHGRDKLNITVKGFKSYAFSTKRFRNQIRQLAQGTKVYAISSKNFKECYINIPSKDEQSKIAKILSLIAKKIAIEKKLLHELQKQKNSLLKKLFI
jgi:type I restriction enzyme S subunit